MMHHMDIRNERRCKMNSNQWAENINNTCQGAGVSVWNKKYPDTKGKASGDLMLRPEWARRREFPK
jgi:hypothetical protein